MNRLSKKKKLLLPYKTDVFPSPVRREKAGRRAVKAKLKFLLTLAAALTCALSFASCKREIDPFDSVSELRGNLFLAECGELKLTAYAVSKESPYVTDGIKRQVSDLLEVRLFAPSGDGEYLLSFEYDGKSYGGDMSFDNVKTEYFYSCSLDVSEATELPFTVSHEGTTVELNAVSVRTENTLSPREILRKVREAEAEKFNLLTTKNGFAGEIYLRLIYEEAPYYYIGVIDRQGKIFALLADATTGKILARRES